MNIDTNDAPVTVEQGIGWVFWNPDSGEEYSTDHPIRSGECVEAERVRPSTPQEDTLWAAMQEQFQRAERLAARASAPAGDGGGADKDGGVVTPQHPAYQRPPVKVANEVAQLRQALLPFVKHWAAWMDEKVDGNFYHADDAPVSVFADTTFGDLRRARAALAGQTPATPPVAIDYESALFDVLETLKAHYPQIAGGFARGTGGFDRDYILDELRKPASAPAGDGISLAEALKLAFQAADPDARYKFEWADFGSIKPTDMGQAVIDALFPLLAAALARPRSEGQPA